MKARQLILFTILTITACKEEIPSMKQKVLFEVHYQNWAWGYQNSGFLLDSLGNIHKFNFSYKKPETIQWVSADSSGYISENDMNKNLSLCDSILKSNKKDSLGYYTSKIWYASKGTLSKPEYVMADAGAMDYYAYIYDPVKNRYKQILLYQWGDLEIVNHAPEAREIVGWLVRFSN